MQIFTAHMTEGGLHHTQTPAVLCISQSNALCPGGGQAVGPGTYDS